MKPQIKLCFLLFVIYVAIIGVFVGMVFVVKNDRQVTRRIFRQIKPCPFAKGQHFEVVEKLNTRTTPPTFLFSTCLFGKPSPTFEQRYVAGLNKLIDKVKQMMPEAQVRVYLTISLADAFKSKIAEQGAEVFVVSPNTLGYEGTMWRFFAFDGDLPAMIVDADDTIVTEQLIGRLRAWLNSSTKQFFSIRTSMSSMIPLTGGRFAAKPGSFGFNMQAKTEEYCETAFGVDEGFLNREVWPLAKSDVYTEDVTPEEALAVGGFLLLGAIMIGTLYYGCTKCD